MKIFVSAIGGLALGCCCGSSANAWTHGTTAATTLPYQTISFGAKTPAGFGGTVAGSTTGALTAINATTCGTSAFTIVAGSLVPGGVYGAAGPLSAQSCNITLTNGIDTTTDPVVIVPNVWTITPRPATDTATANQLVAVIGSAMNLGDTIICRDGIFNSNPNSTNGARWFPTAPATQPNGYPWTGTGRITLTSEHIYAGTDPEGNPIQGGGCQLAYIYVSQHSGADVPLPLDLRNLTFTTNVPNAYVGYLLSFAPGMGLYNSDLYLGPSVTNANSIRLAAYAYSGALPSPAVTTASNGLYNTVTMDHNSFHNGQNISKSGAANSYPQIVFTNNVVHDMLQNGLASSGHGGDIITDNLFYGNHANGAAHGDAIIFNTTYEDGTVQQGPTLARNILIHGHAPDTIATLSPGTITTGACANLPSGTTKYLQEPSSGGTGNYGYLDVTVTNNAGVCSFSAVITDTSSADGNPNDPNTSYSYQRMAGGGTQTGGFGYAVGDIVNVALGGLYGFPSTGVTVNFTVQSLQPGQDTLGVFHALGVGAHTPPYDSVTGTTVTDNIYELVDGTPFEIQSGPGTGAGNAVVNFNDGAIDFQNFGPGQGGIIATISMNDQNPNANYNTTNNYSFSGASGTITCLPGSLSDASCIGPTQTARLSYSPYALTNYQAVWRNYNTQSAYLTGCANVGRCFNRANAIRNHEPTPGGAGYVSSNLYATALCPRDNAGILYWNTGVCDATAIHQPAM